MDTQVAVMATMDSVLDYVGYGSNLPQQLGGAAHGNGTHRAPRCQIPGISAPKRDLQDADFKMRVGAASAPAHPPLRLRWPEAPDCYEC